MPVEFLSDEQASAFGRFAEVPSQLDLTRTCVLDASALTVIGRHRGEGSRSGFAVQLATVRLLGMFLADPLDVPWEVVTFLASQLGVVDPSMVKAYTERAKTPYEHQWEITQTFGYRTFADPAAQGELRTFLGAPAWMSAEGPLRLFERSAAWLRAEKVLLPGLSVLARLVSEVRAEQADRLHIGLSAAAGPGVLARLERLLDVAEGERVRAASTVS
jgi:hypothetical protein